MPKPVTLTTGLQFASISAGVEHFSAMLDAQDLKKPFAGADEEHIRAAYDAYCAKTEWTTPSPAATSSPFTIAAQGSRRGASESRMRTDRPAGSRCRRP